MCSDSRKIGCGTQRYADTRAVGNDEEHCGGCSWPLNLEAAVAQGYPASTPAPARLVLLSQVEEALNVLKIVSFKHAQEAISNQNDAIARPPLVPLLK